jgi:hypothetical protein
MKTIYTSTLLIAAAMLFTSCERCFECRIMQSSTNQYGQMQPQPPIIIEQCGMTRRENKQYVEQMTTSTTVIINNKKYTTDTRVSCKEIR